MQDGKGALYFTKPIHECGENFPGPARPLIKPQATPKTRDQIREDSPSGYVSMEHELDWHGKHLLLLMVLFVVGLIASYAIF